MNDVKYYSLEETYLMALRCVEDQQKAILSLLECRDEENNNPIEVMLDFIQTEKNEFFEFTLQDVTGHILFTWESICI